MKEARKRDYKDEYKKFQSSAKSKKYRAELNKYNRKKGTYGNGDDKDASHKGGKIVGFESQSKNRGRAEKSRLKKESTLNENPAAIAAVQAMVKLKMKNPKTGKDSSAASALKNKDNPNHKKAKSIFQRLKDKFSKKKDDKPKKQSKSDADFYKRQYESINESRANVIKAIAIAKKMSGNMTGAVKKIEKIQKGLSKQIEVEDALRKANESVNEAKSKTIKTIGSIIGKRQAKKIDGVLVDMQTANVIMKVWNALSSSNRSKFEKLPIKKMATVAWKLVK